MMAATGLDPDFDLGSDDMMVPPGPRNPPFTALCDKLLRHGVGIEKRARPWSHNLRLKRPPRPISM
jgi:hypothetical protein